MKPGVSRYLWILVVALCCSGSAMAQFSSSIEGTVSDSTGAIIPGATVVLTGIATGVKNTTTSNSAGFYKFPSLGSGSYRVSVTAAGFGTQTVDNITLTAEQTRGIPVTLLPKSDTNTVTVEASALTVDTDEAKIGSVTTQKDIEELPLQGRNVFNVANQSPGVTGTGLMGTPAQNQDIFQDTTTPAVVANGAPNHSNTYLLDGISLDDSPSGGDAKLVPSPDSLQEVTITTSDYSAQFGKAASLVMQMTTRAGTNKFHGSGFLAYQSSGLTARRFTDNFKIAAYGGDYLPPLSRKEFGGSFGGPIFKDRTFFFLTYDGVRSQVSNDGQTTFEDPAFTSFEGTNYPNTLSYQLMKSYPVTNANPTPTSILNVAQVQSNFQYYPTPAQDCRNAGKSQNPTGLGPLNMPCSMNLFDVSNTVTVFPHNGYQYHARIDQNFPNQKDRIYGSMFAGSLTGAGDTNPRKAFETQGVQDQWFGAVNYTHIFNASLVNETGYGFSRISFFVPCNVCNLLYVGSPGFQNFGNGGSPVGFAQNDFHFRDMVSIVVKKHAMKAGFEMFHNQDVAPFTPNDNRNQGWGFDNPWDFATGQVDEYGQVDINPVTGGVANGDHYYHDSSYGAYLQDDWRARKDLSLNMGIRWDANSNPSEAHGNLNPLIVPQGLSLMDQIAGVAVDVTPGIHHPFIDLKKSYFAPRFGFSYQPNGLRQWSIRGGAGIFFDRGGNTNWSDTEAGNPPGVYGVNTSIHNQGPQPPTNFSLCTSATFPYGCPIPAGILAAVAAPNGRGGYGTTENIGGTDPHLKLAYLENVFLGVQHTFHSNWLVEADGTHASSIHEYSITNLNRRNGEHVLVFTPPDPATGVGYGAFNSNASYINQADLPNPLFSNINYTTNAGRSDYEGFVALLRKTYSHGYSFQISYTFEKTIDLISTAPGAQKGAEYSVVVDAYNVNAQRALSSQNIPQQISANGLWELPTPFLQNGLAKNIVGGWQLSALSAWIKGIPTSIYSTRAQDDFNLDGQNYDFPNRPVAGIKLKGYSQKQFLNGTFNQNATVSTTGPSWPFTNFPLPVDQNGVPTGVEGNGGRNTVEGPGFVQVDSSLVKNVEIPWFQGERGKLQFKVDMYNVFNHKNLQGWDTNLADANIDPNTGAISGNFGKTPGQGQARTLQLEGQFRF
jgi:hypothetical protein